MAGNIIPSVATTNAIIAGIAVTQAIKVLLGNISDCKTVYYAYGGNRPQLLYKESLLHPNPNCPICQAQYLSISSNYSKSTLQDLIKQISDCKSYFPTDFEYSLLENDRILYDPDFDDNLPSTLESLGITSGSILTLLPEDESTNPTILIAIQEKNQTEKSAITIEKCGSESTLYGANQVPKKRKLEPKENGYSQEPNTGSKNAGKALKKSGTDSLPSTTEIIDLESTESDKVLIE
ncbi:hypothetical protein BB560_007085 [Smittium megazygosporum]|nr:hypothetical protein BB560_007085 [Smittium megazygosporum]